MIGERFGLYLREDSTGWGVFTSAGNKIALFQSREAAIKAYGEWIRGGE